MLNHSSTTASLSAGGGGGGGGFKAPPPSLFFRKLMGSDSLFFNLLLLVFSKFFRPSFQFMMSFFKTSFEAISVSFFAVVASSVTRMYLLNYGSHALVTARKGVGLPFRKLMNGFNLPQWRRTSIFAFVTSSSSVISSSSDRTLPSLRLFCTESKDSGSPCVHWSVNSSEKKMLWKVRWIFFPSFFILLTTLWWNTQV